MKKALILVDLQNDFCAGGALASRGGDEIIPLANKIQDYFDLIVASLDWHPSDHLSFASNHIAHKVGEVIKLEEIPQVLWPNHCVQHTKGAEFHPQLKTARIKKIFHKGVDKKIDGYSAFFDNAHRRSTGLGEFLHQLKVEEVYIMGIATDYCVKYSALDALNLKFKVNVITDGCRGIELNPGDMEKAFQIMEAAGVSLLSSDDIISNFGITAVNQ